MDYGKLGFGLGVASVALAAAEVFGSKRIAQALDAEGHEGLIRGFGARNAPRNRAVRGAIAFVVGATVLDALVAVGLDRETGRTPPVRHDAVPA